MSKIIEKMRYFVGVESRKMIGRKIAKKEMAVLTKYTSRSNDVTNALLLSHSLEKGMGIQNIKEGYGIEKAIKLCNCLKNLKEIGQDNIYAYNEGLAVLWSFINFQESAGVNISTIKDLAKQLGQSSIQNAGCKLVPYEELMMGKKFDFAEFVNSRHSIRRMTDVSITEDEIKCAIDYAKKAPSACNRQPVRMYYSLDNNKNRILAGLIPGNKGFADDIPYYGVVTSDRSLFGPDEAFQWFVNGGIFLGYFILALHSIGIGSCIFQWPSFNKNDAKLRSLIHADDSETIIAIVGFGKYPNEAKCIYAERRHFQEIASVF